MSILRKFLIRLSGVRFEDYEVHTGYTKAPVPRPWARIRELFSLVGIGDTPEDAIRDLARLFYERVHAMRKEGRTVPPPGSGPGRGRFAASDQIEVLRPFVDEFWSEILGTSYATSFVSNESKLTSWERYLPGGREELLQRVARRYCVDISGYYDAPIPEVLGRIRNGAA